MLNVIVMPTYNERNNITAIIPLIFQIVPEIHIMVVDDNSPDGTAVAVRGFQKKYPNLSLISRKMKDGLGKAYIHGFTEVLKDKNVKTVIMMDADLSHHPKELEKMLELRKGFDVVVGSRYVKGGATENWELYRRILSRGGNFYARVITGLPTFDCTGGFNAINADVLRKIKAEEINVSGYAFIMHLKFLLWKEGATFTDIPILFKNRVDGVSKLSNLIIREGILAPWKMVFDSKKKN